MKIKIFAALCLWLGMSLAAMEPTMPMGVKNKVDKVEWANALKTYDLEKVEELLKQGIDPNEPYECQNIPLSVTIFGGGSGWIECLESSQSLLLMKLLLKYGANPNLPLSYMGITALSILVSRGIVRDTSGFYKPWGSEWWQEEKKRFLEAIQLLLDHGADPYKEMWWVDGWGNKTLFDNSAAYKAEHCHAEELITLFKNARTKLAGKMFLALTEGPFQFHPDVAKIIVKLRYDYKQEKIAS